jgi:hypothetical protein
MSFIANQWPLYLTSELVELFVEEMTKKINIAFSREFIIWRARHRDKGDE